MLLLGIDIGTSFIKVTVVDSDTKTVLTSVQSMDAEAKIISHFTGWAEQSPEGWWDYVIQTIHYAHATKKYDPKNIKAIGISYQMHGLVLIDKKQKVLRDAIIWCDSRAVEIGDSAYNGIGEEICQSSLLNSPGNFTASKLAWIKNNEPEIYKQIYKIMLPGDFIGMKLTGKISTTPSALSEGIFWDFKKEEISFDVLQYFEFDENMIPEVRDVFSIHGYLKKEVADELGLNAGTPLTYKAGDQLNNALSLNVMQPGDVAASAGTSGVIYGVTDRLFADQFSRVNSFAHVNHIASQKRLGILLCINGTGILNSWIKNLFGGITYDQINIRAALTQPGSDGLIVFSFGNGAERMLQNKIVGAHLINIDFNKHTREHIYRAEQEGIAFAFRYGLDIMRENGMNPKVIRAGSANLFLSEVFIESFVNATGVTVELYANDGSTGAAIGAGIGAGFYKSFDEAFNHLTPLQRIEPTQIELYEDFYQRWKQKLNDLLL